MSISTYAELEDAIENWLKRSDLADYIPDFITLGEARIFREVRARVMEQRTTSTLSTTSAYINVPSDLLELRSVWLTSGSVARPLQYALPDVLLRMYNNTSGSGEPQWYTIVGDEMRFGPVPDSAYSVELWYYKRLTALSSSTNSLFSSNPDLYLYAALTSATPFLKDDKRIAIWEQLYGQIRDQVNKTEEAGRRSPGMQMVAA